MGIDEILLFIIPGMLGIVSYTLGIRILNYFHKKR